MKGLFSERQVIESGLPVFDLTKADELPLILFTYTQLKEIGYHLNDEQRQRLIRAFLKSSNRMKGYAALYDLRDVSRLLEDGYAPWYSSGGRWGGRWDDPERDV